MRIRSEDPSSKAARRGRSIIGVVVLAALMCASCTAAYGSMSGSTPCSGASGSVPIPQPSAEQMAAAGLAELPTAPPSERVDLTAPPFSDPTDVTNPLFPISQLRSAVLDGRIDDQPFHTETTLLPYTRIIEWSPGQCVETLVSQYAAFLNGRIQEVALDYYAQADDGSVWYFGEDVADYDPDGVIAFTTDSWLAGRNGPPAMIMPGSPQVGQAFRTENIPGLVFEEVTVKTTDQTVAGPLGLVHGAMVGQELHDDGMTSDKVFAPGYGEFLTRDSDGVEAMAVAVPTDALPGPVPADLRTLGSAALRVLHSSRSIHWGAAKKVATNLRHTWTAYSAGDTVPVRLKNPMDRALSLLEHAISARARVDASVASIDVAQAALDLELPFRPPVQIDIDRFELWAQQVLVDAPRGDAGAVSGDLASLEWTRERFSSAIDPVDRTRIDHDLLAMREAQVDGHLHEVARRAVDLLSVVSRLQVS